MNQSMDSLKILHLNGYSQSQVGAAGPRGSLVLLVAFIGIIELCSL